MIEVNEYLCQVLVEHGVRARLEDGWVVTEHQEKGPVLRGQSIVHASGPAGMTVRIDVQVALPDGRLLTESFASAGIDAEKASESALRKFSASCLHVILGSLLDQEPDDQVEIEEWDIDDTKWNAHISAVSIESLPPPGQTESVPIKIPDNLILVLRPLARGRVTADDVQWIRVFFAQRAKEQVAGEVLLNNEEWPEAEAAVSSLSWSEYDGYYSVRAFVILKKASTSSRTEEEPPRRDFRWVEAGVRLLVDACEHEASVGDEELYALLLERGYDPDLANRLVAFSPMGFSRVLLHDLKLPKDYSVVDPEGKQVETGLLAREPSFVAAREVAAQMAPREEAKGAFLGFAARCAILNAANQALQGGAKLEDLELAPPVLSFRPSDF